MLTEANTRSGSTTNQGMFQKATAAVMSVVLAVGLCPIAYVDRAWADGPETETTTEVTETTGTTETTETTGNTGNAETTDTTETTETTETSTETAETTTGSEAETDTPDTSSTPAIIDAESLKAAVLSSGTIALEADIDLGASMLVVPADVSVTLDLNGHILAATKTVISNSGTLTVKDSGTGGAIKSAKYQGIQSLDASTTNFESGTIESVEGAIMPVKNSHVNISGGTLKASDNAVIIMNGSMDGKYAGNTVNITGGTFVGSIKSADYIACGIYVPNADTVNVTGGTFNITGGAGVVARAGNVNLGGDVVINTTGTATGKVGDSRIVVPSSAIVFDDQADYPALTDSSGINVTGGTFKSAENVAAISCIDDTSRVTVSAGTYSSQVPADLIPVGYQCTAEGDVWKVSIVQAVKEVHDAIGALDATSSTSAVRQASAAYNGLADELKPAISADELEKLNLAIQVADTADRKAAADATALIEAAKASEPAGVEAARAAYEALSADQKKLVSEETLLALENAEAQALENAKAAAKEAADKAAAKEAADKVAANSVTALVAAMDATSVVQVKAARAAFDMLTVDQKSYVPANALKMLADAEAALASPKTSAKITDIALASGALVNAKVTSAKGKTLTITGSTVPSGAKITLNTARIADSTYKVSSIAANAFKNTKAASVTLGTNVKTVGASAFANASALTKATVGNSVTKLGAKAFAGDKKLAELTLGSKVKTIGKSALSGCSKLTKVTVKSSKLTKTSFKNLLKGSKVKTVKLKGVSKAAKAKYKKWAPKGVTVK